MRQASGLRGTRRWAIRGEGALSGAACALAFAALVAAAPAGADDAVIDGIAAQVGSDIVLVSEVRNLIGPDGGQDARRRGSRERGRGAARRRPRAADRARADPAGGAPRRARGHRPRGRHRDRDDRPGERPHAGAARHDRRERGAALRRLPRAHPRRDRAVEGAERHGRLEGARRGGGAPRRLPRGLRGPAEGRRRGAPPPPPRALHRRGRGREARRLRHRRARPRAPRRRRALRRRRLPGDGEGAGQRRPRLDPRGAPRLLDVGQGGRRGAGLRHRGDRDRLRLQRAPGGRPPPLPGEGLRRGEGAAPPAAVRRAHAEGVPEVHGQAPRADLHRAQGHLRPDVAADGAGGTGAGWSTGPNEDPSGF